MPFPFSYVCDLLQHIEDNLKAKSGQRNNAAIVAEWFDQHRGRLKADNCNGAALLSTLLPHARSDRVYFMQATKLEKHIGRALGLGKSRIPTLLRYRDPGSGADLADCVEEILTVTPNQLDGNQVPLTIEFLDHALHGIASRCHFSAPSVRAARHEALVGPAQFVAFVYKRVTARDAKWLTRLILKNFAPVELDEQLIYRCFNPLLPVIMKVQHDFAAAVKILVELEGQRGVIQGPLPQAELLRQLKPTLSFKIGRQPFWKARSLKQCLEMGRGRMSCEQKVDGEYCQIHVDLARAPSERLKIFSKSGKVSTQDRGGVHDTIIASLRLGQPDCPLQKGCILEAELVVYSDATQKILDFDKIRKYVNRSGWIPGKNTDSQPVSWEHLMVVYFDVLMIDDDSMLEVRRSQRFARLVELIQCRMGHAELVRREEIDFSGRLAMSDLKRVFARTIANREEGLVLKADDPYFDFGPSRQPYSCGVIKLKKEYIGNYGDVGDFAVVGARYDAVKAKEYGIAGLKWTHFYVGCLMNKDAVERESGLPIFQVTNVVELNATQLRTLMNNVSPNGVAPDACHTTILRFDPGVDDGRRPSTIFTDPPVFDVRCFSFEKLRDTTFQAPRFPVVTKVHLDRTWRDVLTFSALQELAAEEKTVASLDDSQELLDWMAKIEAADPTSVLSDTPTQTTTRTATTIPETPSRSSVMGQSNTPSGTGPQPSPAVRHAVSQRLTPPRSSAVTATVNVLTAADSPPLPSSAIRHLRDRVIQSPRAAMVRKKPMQATPPSSRSPRKLHLAAANNSRRVLMDITTSFSSQDNASQHSQHVRALPTIVEVSHEKSLPMSAAVASVSGRAISPALIPPPSALALTVQCKYRGHSCILRRFAIALAPCIAQYPWVTENLLNAHGKSFVTNLAALKHVGAPDRRRLSDASPAPTRRSRRLKKLALVERRREDAMHSFLAQIDALQLRRADGSRDWVHVLDWRILEALAEEEKNRRQDRKLDHERLDMGSMNSIWRKYSVGLA